MRPSRQARLNHSGAPGCSAVRVHAVAGRSAAFSERVVAQHLRNAQELSSSLNTFRGIFDSIGEALFIQDHDRRFLDANASAEQVVQARAQGLPEGDTSTLED